MPSAHILDDAADETIRRHESETDIQQLLDIGLANFSSRLWPALGSSDQLNLLTRRHHPERATVLASIVSVVALTVLNFLINHCAKLVGDLLQPSTYIEDIIAFHFLIFHGSG
jgi:hypothetical protein